MAKPIWSLGAWQRAKTHCPHGHPYDDANTYWTSSGHRQCIACTQERARTRMKTGYYVKGWRDQECPICGAKWFVNVTAHIRQKHGIIMKGLVSDDFRFNAAAILTDLNQFDCDPAAVRARRQRWATTIIREQNKGGDYIKRLAKLWRMSHAGADQRIARLITLGLVPGRPGVRALYKDPERCKRGHILAEVGTYETSGRWFCKACHWIRYERYQLRKNPNYRSRRSK